LPITVYATSDDLVVPAQALSMFSAGDKTDALEKASQLADGYLNSRFRLPLTAWGDDLTDAVAVVATYKLIMKRGYKPGSVDNSELYQRYKDALSWLDKVAKGTVTPTNVVDSSASGTSHTDAAGESKVLPFVIQPYGGDTLPSSVSEEDDFFGHSSDSGATYGTPRRRGW
jgi:phage gp36-like protein